LALPDGVDFYINENRILEPLDLVVLRDSRVDLFPRVKERVEEIPGRHGEIDFGSKLEPRILELHVAVSEEFSLDEREKKKREIAGHLNPTMGTKVLVFADEPDKQYFVKYSGIIDITRQYTSWFEFTIPFKCSDPYIYSKLNVKEKLITSSLTTINLSDNDSMDTLPVIIVENEGVTAIGGFTISYLQEIEGD
jgi:predicted phage tail component-like protein